MLHGQVLALLRANISTRFSIRLRGPAARSGRAGGLATWRIAGLLLAGLLSACVSGPPTGIPPHLADLHAVAVTGSAVLAAPPGWSTSATITTPQFAASPPVLYRAVLDVLTKEPRTWLTVDYPVQGQAFFIVRSIVFNLPDIVVVQVLPGRQPDTSNAVILSRSRYDTVSFFSGNRARVQRLIARLADRVGTVPAANASR